MARLDTVEGAVEFATRAHDGQVDKQGAPYILHPLRVAARLHEYGDHYVIAGLLHDIVEDTYHTVDDLIAQGAPIDAVEAVELLTRHDKREPYVDYIERLTRNPIAGWVKASDIADNLNRLDALDEATAERLSAKYLKAVSVLAGHGYFVSKFLTA
jgi:(p)ppGpp synthase/HD superfamily hydrolase